MHYLSAHLKDLILQLKLLTGRDFCRSLNEFADKPGARVTRRHRTQALIAAAPEKMSLEEESQIIPRDIISQTGEVEAECLVLFVYKDAPKEPHLPWSLYSKQTNLLRKYLRRYIREVHRLAF